MSVLERVHAAQSNNASDSREGGLGQNSQLSQQRSDLKKKLVSQLGLSTISQLMKQGDIGYVREELTVACQEILNENSFDVPELETSAQLIRQVVDEICGLGPIQPLLEELEVTEIMINGCGSLFYEKNGEIREADAVFDSPEQILIVMDRILAPLGRRLDQVSPIVDARLANGDRVNAVAEPIAINGPAVTIRRFTGKITSLSRLIELGSLPSWLAQLLSWAVKMRKGIAVVGGTGSGKTTLLNALSCEIDVSERIVTIEDSAELRFDAHPNVVRLEARSASIEGTGEITIRRLVRNALRMRPDRIIVGEVRGEECIDMLQAMNTGHDGSLSTGHANSDRDMLLRLETMMAMGEKVDFSVIQRQIVTGLDILIHLGRMRDRTRKVLQISELCGIKNGEIYLNTLYRFQETGVKGEKVHGIWKKESSLQNRQKLEEKGLAYSG